MNKTEFWEMIEAARTAAAEKDLESESAILSDELSKHSLDEIANWHLILVGYMEAANQPELIEEKRVLGYFQDGNDDDHVMFRAWMISCGKETFFRALRDPASLADAPAPERHGNYKQYANSAYPAYVARQLLDGHGSDHDDLWTAVRGRMLNQTVMTGILEEIPSQRTRGGAHMKKEPLGNEMESIAHQEPADQASADIQMEELLNSGEQVYGFVEEDDGYEEYVFQKTPENIASFIGSRPMARAITITDPLDRLIVNTFGNFINQCPDQKLLGEIKKVLIPIQLGEAEPSDFFCPTMDQVEEYYIRQESAGQGFDQQSF